MTDNYTTSHFFINKFGNDLTSRDLKDWMTDEVVNVKAWGAVGNGMVDDTSAIQQALNAAFGTTLAPHGANTALNRKVFFPAGDYLVSAPGAAKTVTAVVQNGDNTLTWTVSDTTGISATGQIVVFEGVACSGSIGTYANGTKQVKQGDSVGANLTTKVTSLYAMPAGLTGSVTSNGTLYLAALTVADVRGGHIFGTGPFSTSSLHCFTANGIILLTDGLYRSKIEGMQFRGDLSGAGGYQRGLFADKGNPNYPGSQTNIFENLEFITLSIACELGTTGGNPGYAAQMSECIFLNCCFDQNGWGLVIGRSNANALQQTIIGGNFQSHTQDAILSIFGGVGAIISVGFQATTNWDIEFQAFENQNCTISGCRTESSNFANVGPVPTTFLNCVQATVSNVSTDKFVSALVPCHLSACQSKSGFVELTKGGAVDDCVFGSLPATWLKNNATMPVYTRNMRVGGDYQGSGPSDQTQAPVNLQWGVWNIEASAPKYTESGINSAGTKAGGLTTSDVAQGCFAFGKNSTSGKAEVYYNDGGTLKVLSFP